MELPPGVPDPIFLCELALELKMPVGELADRMSLHELSVIWPAFFAYRDRAAKREQKRREAERRGRG